MYGQEDNARVFTGLDRSLWRSEDTPILPAATFRRLVVDRVVRFIALCALFLQLPTLKAYSRVLAEQSVSPRLQLRKQPPVRAEALTRDGATHGVFLDDPCLGMHWRLIIDPLHPEQPGRWQLVRPSSKEVIRQASQPARNKVLSPERMSGRDDESIRPGIVIRAGDKVMVTQGTAEINARLLAVALEPARAGERFDARLLAVRNQVSSSAVLVVQASGPGEAVWIENKESQH